MSKRNRIPTLCSLLVLLIGILVCFLSDAPEAGREGAGGSSEPAVGQALGGGESKRPRLVPAGRSLRPPRGEDAEWFVPQVSHLRRGADSRLLLEEAVVVERDEDARAVSDEVVFRMRGGRVAGPLTWDEHTVSAIEAFVDLSALAAFLDSEDGAIRIPLSRDREVLATIDQVVTRGAHTTTLLGHVVGDSYSDILLVFHDGAVSGSVAFHDTNTHYQFGAAGNGAVAIRELDPHSFTGGCAGCDHPEHLAADIAVLGDEPSGEEGDGGEVLGAPAGSDPFDIVVGYSDEAAASDGGTAAIEARIIAAVDRLNQALSNSEAGDWFCSLLATLEVEGFLDSDYTGMGAILTDLNQTSDGVLDTVTDLKVELGADQATFVCDNTIGGTAGVANRPGVHCIVARTYMSSTRLTFAHEVGHNLGLRHAWGDSGSASTNPTNNHNYGWRFRTSGGTKVRTIMAYNSGWSGSRIPYFANPDVSYNGALTGAVDGFDATDTSATPDWDQQMVEDGIVGGLGPGFDGSNPGLGARNGHYLFNNSGVLANKDTREPLAVLEPVANAVLTIGSAETIYWHGGDHTDTVDLELFKDGTFQTTIASGISGEARWFDWTVPNVADGYGYTIRATLSGSTMDVSDIFSIGTPVVSLPYSEGFEDGFGAWRQSLDDDMDWTRNSGGTPTANTGPDGASGGDWYLYMEPHDDYNGHNKVVEIDCTFDLSTVPGAELRFDYHMYGTNVDYLAVDVHDGTTWTTDLWLQDGQAQASSADPWAGAVVDLSAYAGNDEVTIRFRAKQGYWHVSDIAIDNIVVAGPQALPYAESFEDGLAGWWQSVDDDLDWTLNSGGTPTTNTGPSGAADGSQYMYVENHDSGVQYKTASLEGLFDFSLAVNPVLSFDYHMYGFYIDYLAVDVHDGSSWTNDVWIRTNQQHGSSADPWSHAVVDLSAYGGNDVVTLRFRSKQKQWHAADTAIDNVQINNVVGPLVAHWSMDDNAGAGVSDDTGNLFDASQSGATWAPGIQGSALDFDGTTSTVTLPAFAFDSIDEEITVAMWVYGAGDQPRNDSLFYAVNASGDRVLNIHLPWGNGSVYWDAGFAGTYDRIEKPAATEEYEGRWNHWVFTKDAGAGEMAIYLNGDWWHSGSGLTRSMSGITEATLGSQISGLHYAGTIDEVKLYNVSLDATGVADLFASYATSSGVPLGWLANHGLDPSEAGAQGNNDGDELTNGEEWYFGTNPLVWDAVIKTVSSGEGAMTITYTRRKVEGVSIYAEWSPDMQAPWLTTGLSEVVIGDDGEVETVSVTVPIDLAQKFVRIRVE